MTETTAALKTYIYPGFALLLALLSCGGESTQKGPLQSLRPQSVKELARLKCNAYEVQQEAVSLAQMIRHAEDSLQSKVEAEHEDLTQIEDELEAFRQRRDELTARNRAITDSVQDFLKARRLDQLNRQQSRQLKQVVNKELQAMGCMAAMED